MDKINLIDSLWNIVDPLTVEEAAVLIAGFDPNWVIFKNNGNYSPRTKSQKKLDRFLGVKNRNCRVMA